MALGSQSWMHACCIWSAKPATPVAQITWHQPHGHVTPQRGLLRPVRGRACMCKVLPCKQACGLCTANLCRTAHSIRHLLGQAHSSFGWMNWELCWLTIWLGQSLSLSVSAPMYGC